MGREPSPVGSRSVSAACARQPGSRLRPSLASAQAAALRTVGWSAVSASCSTGTARRRRGAPIQIAVALRAARRSRAGDTPGVGADRAFGLGEARASSGRAPTSDPDARAAERDRTRAPAGRAVRARSRRRRRRRIIVGKPRPRAPPTRGRRAHRRGGPRTRWRASFAAVVVLPAPSGPKKHPDRLFDARPEVPPRDQLRPRHVHRPERLVGDASVAARGRREEIGRRPRLAQVADRSQEQHLAATIEARARDVGFETLGRLGGEPPGERRQRRPPHDRIVAGRELERDGSRVREWALREPASTRSVSRRASPASAAVRRRGRTSTSKRPSRSRRV